MSFRLLFGFFSDASLDVFSLFDRPTEGERDRSIHRLLYPVPAYPGSTRHTPKPPPHPKNLLSISGGQDYLPLSQDQRVAILVNSLGATPPMELLLIARRASSNLEGRGARVERVFCGSFMTSLDMAGASVSVMRVDALSLARYVRASNHGLDSWLVVDVHTSRLLG